MKDPREHVLYDSLESADLSLRIASAATHSKTIKKGSGEYEYVEKIKDLVADLVQHQER